MEWNLKQGHSAFCGGIHGRSVGEFVRNQLAIYSNTSGGRGVRVDSFMAEHVTLPFELIYAP